MKSGLSRSIGSVAWRCMWLAVCVACGREFPLASEVAITMEAVTWPDTLTVTDTAELSVRLVTADGRVVTGAAVSWSSSDPSILDVVALPPAGGAPFDSLATRLRVRALAREIGEVQVTAVIEEGGALQPAVFSRTVNVQARWISISAGYQHSCGVTVTNDAYCWGGGLRLLGNGSSAGSQVPARVVGGLPFGSVSAGWEHSCGTLLDGLMYCWGYNPFGALGSGTTTDQLAPAPVAFGPRFKRFRAGFGYTCGVSDIDTAVCWGNHASGQLSSDASDRCGAAQTPCSRSPVVVRLASGAPFVVAEVSPGENSTCALDPAGTAYCWGDNTRGLLGTGGPESSSVPTLVASAGRFRSISVGGYHACAIGTDGRAWCWGTNQFGELGSTAIGDTCDNLPCARAPVAVASETAFREVSVRGRSSCAITDAGEVWCWGLNDHGQLGSTTTESCAGRPCSTTPRRVESALLFVSVSVGKAHTCGLATNGGAYCWGQQSDGALGLVSSGDVPRPMRVASPRS